MHMIIRNPQSPIPRSRKLNSRCSRTIIDIVVHNTIRPRIHTKLADAVLPIARGIVAIPSGIGMKADDRIIPFPALELGPEKTAGLAFNLQLGKVSRI